jgi:hypothetical protein
MNASETRDILQASVEGAVLGTGEPIHDCSPLSHPQVVLALREAVDHFGRRADREMRRRCARAGSHGLKGRTGR